MYGMDRGMECFGEILLKCIHKLENCLPYGDIIGECLSKGIVTKYEYLNFEAIQNEIKRNRETVLKITTRQPDKIEEFATFCKASQAVKNWELNCLKVCNECVRM